MTAIDHTMRQVYLDIETTGLSVESGDRIVEIGAAEVIDGQLSGRTFHTYLNPERRVHPDAFAVHGLSSEFLRDQPRFESIREALEEFLRGADLLIHFATFDVPFLDMELKRVGAKPLHSIVNQTFDTLPLFKWLFPGQRCNLDALCVRFAVPAETKQPSTLFDAIRLARVCGRVQTVVARTWVPPVDIDAADFSSFIAHMEAVSDLPEGFGLAYLQRHLGLGYRRSISLMNKLCRMGVVEWSLDTNGRPVYHRGFSLSMSDCHLER